MPSLSVLIAQTMCENGWSRGRLGERMGYADLTRAQRRLAAFIGGAIPDRAQATRLAKALGVTDAELAAAVEETGNAAAKREQETAAERERLARAIFAPFAWALTRREIPSPIFAAAIFGVDHFRRVDVQHDIGERAEDLARVVGELCRSHYRRWNGRAGPYGDILAYRFQLTPDSAWGLSTAGQLISKDWNTPHGDSRVTLTLKNGKSLAPVMPKREGQTQ